MKNLTPPQQYLIDTLQTGGKLWIERRAGSTTDRAYVRYYDAFKQADTIEKVNVASVKRLRDLKRITATFNYQSGMTYQDFTLVPQEEAIQV
jgi:hypothetical protein